MNLLLDTNVFIDFVGKRAPFFESAEKVLGAGYFGDVKLWLSAQSTKDAFYVLSHYANPTHVQRAMTHALDAITLVGLSVDDAERGLYLKWDDYEDCLVALAAIHANANYIITRDVKGFAKSMVPAITPDDWLTMMAEEYSLEYAAIDFKAAVPSFNREDPCSKEN